MQVARPAEDMRPDYAPSAAAGPTVLVGLIGDNIQRSRTPRMHENEGHRLGLRYDYRLIDTAKAEWSSFSIADALKAARLFGFAGLNITYPHKQSILPVLDQLSDDAAEIGAVNTVTFSERGSIGHNTDKYGFAEGFRRKMAGADLSRVLQIGAGGAGAAVASAVAELGAAQVFLADIDAGRADALALRLNKQYGQTKFESVDPEKVASIDFSGVINTTPIGMDASPGSPIDPELLSPDHWVADIIYFPLVTELLRSARAKECRTMSGSAMAIFQAFRAFELFTGMTPDSAEMAATFDAFDENTLEKP